MAKYETIVEVYQNTLNSFKGNIGNWYSFLKTASYIYGLPFDDQILIYAQRPNAVAVLEFDQWNTYYGRRVKRYSKGIAVFDRDYFGRTRLKYYFELNDTIKTDKAKPLPLWNVKPKYTAELTETLENSFGIESTTDFKSTLIAAAQNAVEDNIVDYLAELDNSFLKDSFKEAVKESVEFMMLHRCGYTATEKVLDQSLFEEPKILNTLGVVTTDIAKMGLSEIARTIRAIQKREIYTFAKETKKNYLVDDKETERRNNNEQSQRIYSSEHSSATRSGNELGEIRSASMGVLEKSQASAIYKSSNQWDVEQPLDGSRTYSQYKEGIINETDDGNTWNKRRFENEQSNGMGGKNEQSAIFRRGNHTERNDLQLENTNAEESSAFVNSEILSKVLKEVLSPVKDQLEKYISLHSDKKEQSEYLKATYENLLNELEVDGKRIAYSSQENGFHIWEGSKNHPKEESIFSWNIITELTSQLLFSEKCTINSDIKPLHSMQNQQISFFEFPLETGQSSIFEFQITQEVIDEVLRIGTHDQDSCLRICAWYMKDKTLQENIQFLKEVYEENGTGFYFDKHKIAMWYNENGICICEGDTVYQKNSILITWQQAAIRIRELLEIGKYIPQSELDKAADFERQEIAASLWYLRQDFSDEAIYEPYCPTINEIFLNNKGFPNETKMITELLKDADSIQEIKNEIECFSIAYKENKDLLRFNFHQPDLIIKKLSDLRKEQRHFIADSDFKTERNYFISEDEITKIIKGTEEYRQDIYSFYLSHSDKKEREHYLKKYHGEWSGYVCSTYYITYTSKGIFYSHGDILDPYAQINIPWNKVESRIRKLIEQGDFISNGEKEKITISEKIEAPSENKDFNRLAIQLVQLAQELCSYDFIDKADNRDEQINQVKNQLLDSQAVEGIIQTLQEYLDTIDDPEEDVAVRIEQMIDTLTFLPEENINTPHISREKLKSDDEIITEVSNHELLQDNSKFSDDFRFDYQLLSRLQSDCEYYCKTSASEKHLWAGNVESQIKKMRELYAKLNYTP